MNSFFSGVTILALFGCLILGVLYAWLLYFKNRNLNAGLKIFLAVLRVVTVTAIAWLLFAPLIKTTNYTLEKPIVIIGQDNSLSVKQVKAPNFNQAQYEKDLEALKDKLAAAYDVKVYNFSDSVKTGFDFKRAGKLTNASTFFKNINDAYANRNVGAVILATDGIFNQGGNPLYNIEKLNTSIYTIALGDTIPKRDVLIANINYNNLVYLDDEFTIEVQVQAFQSNGESSVLTVSQNGNKLLQQNVGINSNSFIKTIPIKLRADKIGIQKYTLNLSELKNEITTKNNTQTFYIEVIDGRQKVLLASAAPHPDLAVIRAAVSANKHYEVKLALADDLNGLEPSKFDLIILYQLPDVSNAARVFMQKLTTLNQKPIWYIIGAQSNVATFNQLQTQANLTGSNGSLQELYPDYQSGFSSFSLADKDKSVLSSFDPLLSPFGRLTVNTNVSVLMNQRIGQVVTTSPLWFFTTNNANVKNGYLFGEGLWRWKLAEAEQKLPSSVVNDLISKTVQYLSVKEDKRKFKVYTSKSAYDENENILFNATLYNDSYQPVNTADVSLELKNEQGKIFNYLFSKTENAYQLDAGAMLAGNYAFVAKTELGGKKYTSKGSFFVNTLIAEYQQTTANHQLLNTMSLQHHGKMFMPENLSEIATELAKNENVKTLSYEDKKYNELINTKWLFALILLLLTAEWFLRKRNGEL